MSAYEGLACDVFQANRITRGQSMVAGQEHEEWLFAQELELQALRLFVRPEKRHVDFSTKQRLSELRRRGAVNDKLCFVQLIAQNSQDFREPFDFITGQEAHDESGLGGSGGPPRRLGRRFDLRQYQAGMAEKDPA